MYDYSVDVLNNIIKKNKKIACRFSEKKNSAVKRLIAINCIVIYALCNMCVCTVYIYYIYI